MCLFSGDLDGYGGTLQNFIDTILPNSFNFLAVAFHRNSKHMKFTVRQTFEGSFPTDLRTLFFPGSSPQFQPLWQLWILSSDTVCQQLWLPASLFSCPLSCWLGSDMKKCHVTVNVTQLSVVFFFQGLILFHYLLVWVTPQCFWRVHFFKYTVFGCT